VCRDYVWFVTKKFYRFSLISHQTRQTAEVRSFAAARPEALGSVIEM